MHPIDGASMKVLRALEHLKTITTEIARLEGDQPYHIIREPDRDLGGEVIRYELDGAKMVRVPFLQVILADLVHNLRSALDQIAYGLAKPPTFGTAFPIWIDKSTHPKYSFMGTRGQAQIKNMHPDAVTEIERLQPYNRLKDRDPLWILHELWIDDKHRYIPSIPQYSFGHLLQVEADRKEDLVTEDDLAPLATDPQTVVFRIPAGCRAKITLTPDAKLRLRFDTAVPANQTQPPPYAGQNLVDTALNLQTYIQSEVLPVFKRSWF